MGLLGWIVVGFVAGALARPVTGGGWRFGCVGTIVVGVLGGLLGGWLFQMLINRNLPAEDMPSPVGRDIPQ